MGLKEIIKYIDEGISPFSLKEVGIAGSIALALGIGADYCSYRKYHPKVTQMQEQNYKAEHLEQLKNRINRLEEDISKLETKKTEIPQGKPKIINYKKNTNQNNRKRAYPSNRTPMNVQTRPSVASANEAGIPDQRTVNFDEKKDNYNLVAHYFPEGPHARPNQRLKVETYGDNADGDFLTMNIPSLGIPTSIQILKIDLDDNTEYFTEIPHIFLKDINGNNLNLENYLNINYGKLNGTNINSINISPKGIAASAYLKNGTKMLIETKVMNKYGTIENETLEIIIGGRQ